METTRYGMIVRTALSPSAAEETVREALAVEGFGILTEIDVAATLQQKLGIERSRYRILGACNPALAAQALTVDENIGLLLPCNVVVYEDGDGSVVAALDPATMSDLVSDDAIESVAGEARTRLGRAMAAIPERR